MKVKKIDHVVIMVKDLEKAAKLFADLFDIEFSSPNEMKPNDLRSMKSPLGITLLSPLTPGEAAAKILEKRPEGLSALSLRVASIEEAFAEMKSKGIRQIQGEGILQIPEARMAQFDPEDLHGVRIGLVERE